VRTQFHHVNDLAPAIYEAAGVTPPAEHNGFIQIPVTGTSLLYTIDAPDAPTRKQVQYYEMVGHRGLWLDGWKAVTRHTQNVPYEDDQWELYRVDEDFSECRDLAAAEPDRLAAMVDRWWVEAEMHGVLPLDDRLVELFGARYDDHSPHPTSRRYVYRPPMSPLPAQVGALLSGREWAMTARLSRTAGEDGVLFATGTANAGLTVFVEGDQLVLDYNAFGDHTVVTSAAGVPVGDSEVGVRFVRDGNAGDFTLAIDGADAGSVHVPLAMRIMSSTGHSIGYDYGSAVSPRYVAPNRFKGVLHEVEIVTEGGTRPDAEAAAGMSQQ
jgi:arylsulfatase